MQPPVHLIEKYTTHTPTDILIVENYATNVSAGPREQCEDIVCSDCNQYLKNKSYTMYKSCKQICFNEKKQPIEDCCKRQCSGNLPLSMQQDCLEACSTPLNYGNIRYSSNAQRSQICTIL